MRKEAFIRFMLFVVSFLRKLVSSVWESMREDTTTPSEDSAYDSVLSETVVVCEVENSPVIAVVIKSVESPQLAGTPLGGRFKKQPLSPAVSPSRKSSSSFETPLSIRFLTNTPSSAKRRGKLTFEEEEDILEENEREDLAFRETIQKVTEIEDVEKDENDEKQEKVDSVHTKHQEDERNESSGKQGEIVSLENLEHEEKEKKESVEQREKEEAIIKIQQANFEKILEEERARFKIQLDIKNEEIHQLTMEKFELQQRCDNFQVQVLNIRREYEEEYQRALAKQVDEKNEQDEETDEETEQKDETDKENEQKEETENDREGDWFSSQVNEISESRSDFHSEGAEEFCNYGEYQVIQRLHQSSISEVFLLQKGEQHFVLKKQNQVSVNEIEILKKLELFVSAEEKDGAIFLITEFFDGITLESMLVGSRISELQLFPRVVRELRRFHREKIVHGDLSPKNILVDFRNRVQIIDFGLAQDLSTVRNFVQLSGTPSFMAPEIILARMNNKITDFENPLAIDMFSLGCILYWMVFTLEGCDSVLSDDRYGNDEYKIFEEYQKGTLDFSVSLEEIPAVWGNCRVIICEMLNKCLEVNPDKRITIDGLASLCRKLEDVLEDQEQA